jgi:hypothetical protein
MAALSAIQAELPTAFMVLHEPPGLPPVEVTDANFHSGEPADSENEATARIFSRSL